MDETQPMPLSAQILMVDLNNFARYPTLAIGYLVAPLRAAGATVTVLSPLAEGAPSFEREQKETWQEHLKRRVFFSAHPIMLKTHENLRRFYAAQSNKSHQITLDLVKQQLATQKPDIILLSAYLNHYPSVVEIAALAQQNNIPVLLGGPMFNHKETIDDWLNITGISAIFGGEADLCITDIVQALIKRKSLPTFIGLFIKETPLPAIAAPPLQDLDQLPIPDFSDFTWDYYQHRIIPIMTGRGCHWEACTFCSDVITANGRTYRSRSLDHVLDEIRQQTQRHHSKDVIFLDLKLNGNLVVWHGIIEHFQKIVPKGHWIATVHVNAKGENGLSYEALKAAKASGLVRMSFGLETGSQALNRQMAKGTDMSRNAQFVQDAHRAGISLRASMILGYPNESHEDVQASVDFLEKYQPCFDRIRLARFKAIPHTRFAKLYENRPIRFQGMKNFAWDYRYARASYEYTGATDRRYRQAKRRLLRLIHNINRKPLRDDAVQFDGLM